MKPKELWSPVRGWEGLYLVSSLGRVWSIRKRGLLSLVERQNGYTSVRLFLNKTRIERNVHRLMCESFYGPCPVGQQVRHLDGDPSNNRLENLRYGTPTENQRDRIKHGTDIRGEDINTAKLSPDEVLSIRWRWKEHITFRKDHGFVRVRRGFLAGLAEEFGIDRSQVRNIVIEKSWGHVKKTDTGRT